MLWACFELSWWNVRCKLKHKEMTRINYGIYQERPYAIEQTQSLETCQILSAPLNLFKEIRGKFADDFPKLYTQPFDSHKHDKIRTGTCPEIRWFWCFSKSKNFLGNFIMLLTFLTPYTSVMREKSILIERKVYAFGCFSARLHLQSSNLSRNQTKFLTSWI